MLGPTAAASRSTSKGAALRAGLGSVDPARGPAAPRVSGWAALAEVPPASGPQDAASRRAGEPRPRAGGVAPLPHGAGVVFLPRGAAALPLVGVPAGPGVRCAGL